MRIIGTDTRATSVKFLGDHPTNPTFVKTGEVRWSDGDFEELTFRPIIELTFQMEHWWNIKSGMEIIVKDISNKPYSLVNDTIYQILDKLVKGEIEPVNGYLTCQFVIDKKGHRYSMSLYEA